MTIAGHDFQYTIGGRRCVTLDYNGAQCVRSWLEIKDCTDEDVGKPDIAHSGTLNVRELNEIRAERAREETSLWNAVADAASAGSR